MSSSLPAILGGDPAFPSGLQLVKPYVPDVTDRLARILDSGVLTNGPTVRELEEHLEERLQVRNVVAVSSCTAGLMLVLQSQGVNGRVVMPSFTFSASAHAVAWAGGTPVFADVSAESLTLDPERARELVAGAAAMTATHIYGTPCDVEALQAIADEEGIPLVYDAAHALGSMRAGRPIGGFGTAEVFSMSPTKVTTAIEGGIVATNDDVLAEHVRVGRNYGNSGDYDCAFPGLNARMSEVNAAVAVAGLKGLDDRLEHRRELVEWFWASVSGLPGLRMPNVAPHDVSTFKDLTLVVTPGEFGLDVPQMTAALAAEGIDSRRYFFPPIHRQKAYAATSGHGPLDVTDDLAQRVISPPLWSAMTAHMVTRLAEVVVMLHENAAEVRAAMTNGRKR
jgi:dTDP-4-amino-4,6-dideoxygalactose transaminase